MLVAFLTEGSSTHPYDRSITDEIRGSEPHDTSNQSLPQCKRRRRNTVRHFRGSCKHPSTAGDASHAEVPETEMPDVGTGEADHSGYGAEVLMAGLILISSGVDRVETVNASSGCFVCS
jgi:hypothetical protein